MIRATKQYQKLADHLAKQHDCCASPTLLSHVFFGDRYAQRSISEQASKSHDQIFATHRDVW